MGTRFGDGFDIFGTLNFAQPIKLGLERLVALFSLSVSAYFLQTTMTELMSPWPPVQRSAITVP